MKINITPEMIEEARKKRAEEARLTEGLQDDPGTQNVCIGCE